MNSEQEVKIKELIEKYNDILLVSMKLAISEDLVNLMILNKDDPTFILRDLFLNKETFYKIIMREFFKKNSSNVLQELRTMEHYTPNLKKKKLKLS